MSAKGERIFTENPRFARPWPHRQDQEWADDGERKMGYVSKETIPSLRIYEWSVVSKESTRWNYKRVDNLTEWWVVGEENLLEIRDCTWGEMNEATEKFLRNVDSNYIAKWGTDGTKCSYMGWKTEERV